MELLDSGKINNKVKVMTIVTALIVHIVLAAFTAGLSIILLLVTGIITNVLVNKEVSAMSASSNTFKKNFPFRYYGEVFGSFQHVFYHQNSMADSLYQAIAERLSATTPVGALEEVKIADIDSDLAESEARTFLRASSQTTSRGTAITLVLNQSSFGKMHSIEWRVLCGGFIDRDKKFSLIAYSPLTFWFWISAYIKKTHDLLGGIRTIYPASYNEMDIITQIRCIHDAVFNAMIDELEQNGIDTSELKAQKMQVMNISISGGKVSMGNVVQGAMNKVTSVAKGAKA
ncbi:hypothetical protein GCM10011369_30320 [Neiella marina]|uniref:Uncharacterized protein n=1 Tax=Neiella marina TaxID=508461 RepID=A0A8J2U8H3_9GAMM|nr:hypothetical protein [Neiella marina]GGA86201.1 hypothetical protein GCM10011369_30320 [Neiella marina]